MTKQCGFLLLHDTLDNTSGVVQLSEVSIPRMHANLRTSKERFQAAQISINKNKIRTFSFSPNIRRSYKKRV